ncbi:MAG: Brp/Blh family beta-carotene 15,15'-dioxygenase, partial [Planctomycetota bacterium]
ADLFARTRPDRLARFLSDVPTLTDCAAVIASMPKLPFAHEAIVGGIRRRLPEQNAWQLHGQVGIGVTVVLALLAALVMLPTSVQVVLLVAAAAVGMAHGATDVWLGREIFGDDARGRLRFGGGYLLFTAAALALYAVAPTAWLVAFFVLAWLHFGFGELPGLVPRGPTQAMASAVRGAMPLTLPALLHSGDVAWALTALVGASSGGVMTSMLATLAVPTLIGAGLLGVGALVQRRWWDAAEVGAVTVALVFPPPLLAFAIYFAVWHSARHLLSDLIDAPTAGAARGRPWGPVVWATVFPVVAAAVGGVVLVLAGTGGDWFAFSSSTAGASVTVGLVFVTLGCLTFPHMALVAVAALRSRTARVRNSLVPTSPVSTSPVQPSLVQPSIQPAKPARSSMPWLWRTLSCSRLGRSLP